MTEPNIHVFTDDSNEILPRFLQVLAQQNQKGIKEYNTTLADSELDELELLEYALEEVVDAVQYISVAIQRLKTEGTQDKTVRL